MPHASGSANVRMEGRAPSTVYTRGVARLHNSPCTSVRTACVYDDAAMQNIRNSRMSPDLQSIAHFVLFRQGTAVSFDVPQFAK